MPYYPDNSVTIFLQWTSLSLKLGKSLCLLQTVQILTRLALGSSVTWIYSVLSNILSKIQGYYGNIIKNLSRQQKVIPKKYNEINHSKKMN